MPLKGGSGDLENRWPLDFLGIIESPTKAERVRAGLITPCEARIAEHLTMPIGQHVEDFAAGLGASGVMAKHVRETRRILGRILSGCDFHDPRRPGAIGCRALAQRTTERGGIGTHPER